MAIDVLDLSSLELFAGCSPADLHGVAAATSTARRFEEGSVICRQNDTADRWWIVTEGLADVTVHGLYSGTIGPGETIGELALLDGQPRNATVTATTDLVVHEVGGDGFVEALAASPQLAIALLRQMAGRLRGTNRRLAESTPGLSGLASSAVPSVPVSGATPEQVGFNPGAPGFFANPYPQYAALREHEPVHLAPASGAYMVTRYDDVLRLSRDRSMRASIELAASTPSIDDERARLAQTGGMAAASMLRVDGDDHTRLRRLVTKVFTPRAIDAWRDRAEAIVERLLNEAAERGSVDVITDYSLILPSQIISEMLGMPSGDIHQLRVWSDAIAKTLDPINTPEENAASVEAVGAMSAYIRDVVEDKRINPSEDILSALIMASDDGDSLTTVELRAQVILLYIAGHETTTNLVGNGLTHLFEFPDQLDRWRTDPSLDANAIEELLRFDSPVQMSRRIVAEDVEVAGTTIPAGSVALLGLASANRDADKWGPTADVLDLGRAGANQHLSFGGGAHYCLGAALARLEAQIALPRLIRRFPKLAPAYDAPTWRPRLVLRGVEHLHVTVR